MPYPVMLYGSNGEILNTDEKGNLVVKVEGNVGGNGMDFHFGETEPDESLGESGDVYLNSSNGDLYKKENGDWSISGNLKGPQGKEGPQGPQGQQGKEGPQGPRGTDGFPSEEEWNNILDRVSALEGEG